MYPQDPNNMRTRQLNIRLSDEEFAALQNAAVNLGVPTIADAIRVLAQREAANAGKPRLSDFDFDVLSALVEETDNVRGLGPVELLNAVHAMHPNKPRLGNEISASLQKLALHRYVKQAPRMMNCWLMTEAGREANKRR